MSLTPVSKFSLALLLTVVFTIVSHPAEAAPLSQEGLVTLVKLGIGDDAVISKIHKDGLAFTAADETLARLKKDGASDAVLKAVQEASRKTTLKVEQAVIYADVVKLLELGIDEAAILKRLEKSPTAFVLSEKQAAELKKAGASDNLIAALKKVRPAAPQAVKIITDIAVILDCSGSMRDSTTDGKAKMDVAKTVVADLIQKIPDGLNVTFVIYGYEVFGVADDPRNCDAVKVARPLGKLDAAGKSELVAGIAALKPTGATPIALSLRVAGKELAKHDAYCGLVLITDGLETCKGDPAGEAAELAKNPKLTFGVNVVGFDVNADERKSLQGISDAGKGKYYNAASAKELSDAIGAIAKELEVAAQPAEKKVIMRRAIIVHKPVIEEFPALGEIRLISRGLGSTSTDGKGRYEEEIRVPSATTKYEIQWVPQDKEMSPVTILRDQAFAERKLVEIKPEDYLGMVRVSGNGTPKKGIVVSRPGNLGSIERAADCPRFGQVMVVPVGKWNVWIDDDKIEESFEVEPGKLHELE